MTPDDDKPLTAAQARRNRRKGVENNLAANDPGPIVFRLVRTRTASEIYPLKLTGPQREALLCYSLLSRNLKQKIEQVGEGIQVVPVTWNELDALNEEIGATCGCITGIAKTRLMAIQGKLVKFLQEDHAGVFDDAAPKTRERRPVKTDLVFQFRITLLDIKPSIWRRIQVPDCTLVHFHEYIQAAFGWENYHLHQFEIDGARYSQPAPDGEIYDGDFEDETDVRLSDLLPKSRRKARWIYEYDFGDGWRHEVFFEGFPPDGPMAKLPLCLEGKRACPPEDCGGPWGYGDYLAIIADSGHERHEEMLKRRGPYDPEAFDANQATKKMREL